MTTVLAKMEKPITFSATTGKQDAAQPAPAPAADPGHGRERRRSPRRRALKTAQIVFNNGRCAIACHILDTSETGALLMVGDILLCPNEFVLKPLSGAERVCEIAWRKGTRIGIRYV